MTIVVQNPERAMRRLRVSSISTIAQVRKAAPPYATGSTFCVVLDEDIQRARELNLDPLALQVYMRTRERFVINMLYENYLAWTRNEIADCEPITAFDDDVDTMLFEDTFHNGGRDALMIYIADERIPQNYKLEQMLLPHATMSSSIRNGIREHTAQDFRPVISPESFAVLDPKRYGRD